MSSRRPAGKRKQQPKPVATEPKEPQDTKGADAVLFAHLPTSSKAAAPPAPAAAKAPTTAAPAPAAAGSDAADHAQLAPPKSPFVRLAQQARASVSPILAQAASRIQGRQPTAPQQEPDAELNLSDDEAEEAVGRGAHPAAYNSGRKPLATLHEEPFTSQQEQQRQQCQQQHNDNQQMQYSATEEGQQGQQQDGSIGGKAAAVLAAYIAQAQGMLSSALSSAFSIATAISMQHRMAQPSAKRTWLLAAALLLALLLCGGTARHQAKNAARQSAVQARQEAFLQSHSSALAALSAAVQHLQARQAALPDPSAVAAAVERCGVESGGGGLLQQLASEQARLTEQVGQQARVLHETLPGLLAPLQQPQQTQNSSGMGAHTMWMDGSSANSSSSYDSGGQHEAYQMLVQRLQEIVGAAKMPGQPYSTSGSARDVALAACGATVTAHSALAPGQPLAVHVHQLLSNMLGRSAFVHPLADSLLLHPRLEAHRCLALALPQTDDASAVAGAAAHVDIKLPGLMRITAIALHKPGDADNKQVSVRLTMELYNATGAQLPSSAAASDDSSGTRRSFTWNANMGALGEEDRDSTSDGNTTGRSSRSVFELAPPSEPLVADAVRLWLAAQPDGTDRSSGAVCLYRVSVLGAPVDAASYC